MLSKILGGVTLAMGIAVFFLFKANASLSEEVGAARLSIEQAALTNVTNVTTITNLTQQINQCVDERAIDEQANQETLTALRVELAEMTAREPLVEIVREEIFREPSCAELGALDINAVCPALAVELRQRSDNLN